MRWVKVIKRQKSEEEDRISALPDCLIQHILSFLPSTKQAIQTGILSKRWLNQWANVPLLVFDSTGKSDQNFSHFIDRTLILHDCSTIKKFQIKFDAQLGCDPQIVPKLRFAVRKHVEELVLHLSSRDEKVKAVKSHTLPKFLYSNVSLVKLELFKFRLSEYERVNWPNLKELRLDCSFQHFFRSSDILAGCPLLELLELNNSRSHPFASVIASKSLKILSFIDTHEPLYGDVQAEIRCPNLEELRFKISPKWTSRVRLSNKMMDNVLLKSPFLHTLELSGFDCAEQRLMVASKSLKTLVFGRMSLFRSLEISCPCLEEFKFSQPSRENIDEKSLAVKILQQVQHVKLLDIGAWLIQTLEVEDSSSISLNCKCLTLDGNDFDRSLPGIVSIISCSPLLEKLVIRFPLSQSKNTVASPGSNDRRTKNSWNADVVVFSCSVSNLKAVEIIGLSERDDSCKLVFDFVEFLLKNGRVLEKLVFKLGECGKKFIFDVSKKLLSLPRCSPNTNIELL